jgi:type I restriction enzyme, S subunit
MKTSNVRRELKPSGVEWLGDIPVHWEVARSRRILGQRKQRALRGDVQLTASQDFGVISQQAFMDRAGRRVVQVELNPEIQRHVEKGDFVISMRSFQGGIEIARESGCISSAYCILMPKRAVNGRYFAHLLKSAPYIQALQSTSNLVRDGQAMRFENFALVDLPVVPPSEQEAIANFLDRKTAAIDALIAKKERLIELLREKRQALITQAVTKGLDPNVPMKESGVTWLGSVPSHWHVAPLYSRFEVRLGKMLDSARDDGADHRPYLRNANVQWGRIDLEDVKTMPLSAADRLRYRLRPGDLLVCEGGANINVVGKSAIWRGEVEECYYQKALHRVRSKRHGERVEFLLYALWSAFAQGVFIAGANANTVFHLTAEKLRQHRFAFPPPAEQIPIVEALETFTRNFEQILRRTDESVSKLREYRQALVTAAVTGKIDVSKEAA